jgi:hypothetical protein
VVDCGKISGIYLENSRRFPKFDIMGCVDIDWTKAEQAAAKYGIEHVLSVEEIITSPDNQSYGNVKSHAWTFRSVGCGHGIQEWSDFEGPFK